MRIDTNKSFYLSLNNYTYKKFLTNKMLDKKKNLNHLLGFYISMAVSNCENLKNLHTNRTPQYIKFFHFRLK